MLVVGRARVHVQVPVGAGRRSRAAAGPHRLLGRRRSWMLVAQAGIAICLLNMSLERSVGGRVARLRCGRCSLAFCAATQDIAIDAWRIESASVGYARRDGRGLSDWLSLALMAAQRRRIRRSPAKLGWHASYATMAALVGVGVAHYTRWSASHTPNASRDRSRQRRARHRLAEQRNALAARAAHRRRVVHRRCRMPVDRLLRALWVGRARCSSSRSCAATA